MDILHRDIIRRMEQSSTTPEQPVDIPDDTVVFKRSHFYSIMVMFSFAVGILVGYMAWGRSTPAQPAAAAPAQAPTQAPAAQAANPAPAEDPATIRYDIPTEGYPSLGPDNAEIVLVEFSDFECPFCKRWHDDVYEPLLAAYPGQIRFVYRNLPLTSIHPEAKPAAVASLCANEQDAFWAYHDKLFSYELQLGRGTYIQYAVDLELEGESFEACLDSGNYDVFIQEDMDFALNMGVRSTPTFFINGLAVVGAQPIDVFKQVIDQELAGETPE